MNLAANRDDARIMGLLGREYVLERHSSACLASALEAVLMDCLGADNGARSKR